MNTSPEFIVFYLLLVDSVGCFLMTWLGGANWYKKTFKVFARQFPVTKGWATYYLLLVLFIGWILFK